MIDRTDIPDVWTYTPRRYEDDRGWFSETYNSAVLGPALQNRVFVQDNQVLSRFAWTLRGLHFQAPPKAQDKLVRVLRGAILDVAVDIRRNSPFFGGWVSRTLTAHEGTQMFIPRGFAHGYLTLEPDTEVLYKVTEFYSPQHEGGLAWDDPQIAIDWGLKGDVVLAPRDRCLPRLAQLQTVF